VEEYCLAPAQGVGLVVVNPVDFIGGFRPSIVVALSIPFSVLFAAIAMTFRDPEPDVTRRTGHCHQDDGGWKYGGKYRPPIA